MTARIAPWLSRLAVQILPHRRRSWGAAMEAELDHISDDSAAFAFAAGCLFAAVRERVLDFETRFAAVLWSIALASAAFATFHLQIAVRGVQVLLGRPDGFLESLVRGGRADAAMIDSYRSAMPIVIASLLCLGVSHLAAAYFLLRRKLRGFLLAWCSALVSAVAAVSIQLSVVPSKELPSEFLALLIQAGALSLLILWSNQQHRNLRGKI